MNIGKILGTAAKVGATVTATVIAGPAGGATVGGALLGGEAGKAGGRAIEQKTGRPIQKVLGPAGAVALPTALMPLLGQLGIDTGQLCQAMSPILDAICNHPEAAATVTSLLTILGYHLTKNASRSTQIRP